MDDLIHRFVAALEAVEGTSEGFVQLGDELTPAPGSPMLPGRLLRLATGSRLELWPTSIAEGEPLELATIWDREAPEGAGGRYLEGNTFAGAIDVRTLETESAVAYELSGGGFSGEYVEVLEVLARVEGRVFRVVLEQNSDGAMNAAGRGSVSDEFQSADEARAVWSALGIPRPSSKSWGRSVWGDDEDE